jgi:hypothetical protein
MALEQADLDLIAASFEASETLQAQYPSAEHLQYVVGRLVAGETTHPLIDTARLDLADAPARSLIAWIAQRRAGQA